ncbi:FtsX-like permease family protein [Muricauda sp. SCSIO 64092]|uniref:ABC transporter permease n=1 Tax=Allomuricauda sp. SCSIO 64092 TaxID=2908842 RepID=UPI001FF482EA|nr:FtsX-like permease family protein [Muricauda sp. SCSIO 64092]UOY05491.1 FtsX-like permease family protein [Muricauda sp. SCSIO 64092]
MKTLLRIAWRNVWRNKLRSGIVIVSIVLGIWSGLFIMAMTAGLNEQRLKSSIDTFLSHIQIHNAGFLENFDKKDTIAGSKTLFRQMDTMAQVTAYSKRLVLQGMASTAHGNYGVKIMGVFPQEEKNVTDISKRLVQGTYLHQLKRNPIVIGEKLASKLGAKVNSKVVLNFQDSSNNTIATSFRIEGIFKTVNSSFDEGNVFVKYEDLAPLVGLSGNYHEIAILCDNINETVPVKNQITTNNLVESWDELAPELGYAQKTMSNFIYIFMGIILLALTFGIVNTMLMAVLERKREIGMLLSVGMDRRKVFAMIILETLFLALIAAPLGVILSLWTIAYFGTHGIDLSAVGKGLESFGMGSRVHTKLPSVLYLNITLMTLAVTLIAAVVPARRAVKLNPAEAVKAI